MYKYVCVQWCTKQLILLWWLVILGFNDESRQYHSTGHVLRRPFAWHAISSSTPTLTSNGCTSIHIISTSYPYHLHIISTSYPDLLFNFWDKHRTPNTGTVHWFQLVKSQLPTCDGHRKAAKICFTKTLYCGSVKIAALMIKTQFIICWHVKIANDLNSCLITTQRVCVVNSRQFAVPSGKLT
jgi:hypothetical protein